MCVNSFGFPSVLEGTFWACSQGVLVCVGGLPVERHPYQETPRPFQEEQTVISPLLPRELDFLVHCIHLSSESLELLSFC